MLYFIYLNCKIDTSNTHIKQFVKDLLIPDSRFLIDICNDSLIICGEPTKVFMILLKSTDALIMKSYQPLNQWNVSSGQPWLIAAQRDFKQVLHSMITACSSIWIQDIKRMPWSLPPWKQIIHNLIRTPNSIDRIQTVPERNSVHPRSSYVVTIIFRKSQSQHWMECRHIRWTYKAYDKCNSKNAWRFDDHESLLGVTLWRFCATKVGD